MLINGGDGFLGYHLALYILNNSDAKIVIIDDLSRGVADHHLSNLISNKRVSFISKDLTRPYAYNILPTDFDVIYHLAAVNGTKWFYEKPYDVLKINIVSLFNLLEWIKLFPNKPKVCFTSSNEAYAGALESFNQLPIPTAESVPLVVSDTYNPRWTYGGSKLIGELMMIHYGKTQKIKAIIVRPHNFYGPRAGKDHVIPQMCIKIIDKKEPFEIYGKDETRSFCYIDDAVEAMYKLMEIKISEDNVEVFHIGDMRETLIGDLAEHMFEISSWKPKSIISKDSLQGSVKRRLPDTTKIKKAIDWRPKTKLMDGLHSTYLWYKENFHH